MKTKIKFIGLLILVMAMTACPLSQSEIHKARRADYEISQTLHTAIKVKEDLRAQNKLTPLEAVALDEKLIKLEQAALIFHTQVANAPSSTTKQTVAGWFIPVSSLIEEVGHLSFKNPDAQSRFQVLYTSLHGAAQVLIATFGGTQ